MPKRVLFVCTGNICRSPFAEHAARSAEGDEDAIFESAGTHAAPGTPATDMMVSIGDEIGVDLRSHRSRSIDDAEQPDLALCMERSHVNAVRAAFPAMDTGAIRLLGRQPILDPYGQTAEIYQASAAEITAAIEILEF